MYLDLTQLKASQIYFHMMQTLIPRPIAWVLSENKTHSYNLAPFSYFNAVCSDPPLIMLSIGVKPDGSPKDTRVNIEERKNFIIHIAHRDLLGPLNESSASLPANESEVEKLGLATCAFEGSQLPRLEQCRIAYACECYQLQQLGDTPQTIIYGKVNSIYIDDAITSTNDKGHLKVHADKLDVIARLGANEYMQAGDIIHLKRPG